MRLVVASCWLLSAGSQLSSDGCADYHLPAAGYWSLGTLNRFSSDFVDLEMLPLESKPLFRSCQNLRLHHGQVHPITTSPANEITR